MVRAKIVVAALAACLIDSVNAGACKPKPSVSTESQPSSSIVSSTGATETSTMAETSTSAETSTIAVTTTSQSIETISTTSDTATTSSAVRVVSVCGLHGTCSPASDGCRSRSAGNEIFYLGECQDLCLSDNHCKSILYNSDVGGCFLNTNIAQDSGFYEVPAPQFVWYDNGCDIEKREPDPICGVRGDCNQSRCEPMGLPGSYTTKSCQEACAADEQCGSIMFAPAFNGCYFLPKSVYKSGFYEQSSAEAYWYDLACSIEEGD
ncbi:hypothetical protein FBEOM_3249 [Fusarium beomiforme]|uniref:Apple domain-containing protein n=1 Tax=Fusarium beomiforme TaxID=44412 RepID=A0A9P5AQ25_9HYPO|nr:hypothetical protein FBEOM_3249 [Fusarium beomiforme]